jgi:hypothetical protein
MAGDNGQAASDELSNAVEIAMNLVYLIRADYEDPQKVMRWAEMAESQLQRVAKIVSGRFR